MTSGSVSPCSACAGNVPNGWTSTTSAAGGHSSSIQPPRSRGAWRTPVSAGSTSSESPTTVTHQGQIPKSFASPASFHESSRRESAR